MQDPELQAPPDDASAPSHAQWRRWGLRLLVYLVLALILTWPLALHLGTHLPGYPNVDAQDTVMLRGLVADLLLDPLQAPNTDRIYYPQGFPLLHLTPNLLDHLTAAPLVWLLPFPLADNLWWLGVLVLNGLAAHHLGLRLAGPRGSRWEAAGWLAGIAFMTSEPLLREANLHHAPQAMMFWAPLYLAAVVDLWRAPRHPKATRRAALAALWLSLAALSYWYYGLFLGLATLPLLLRLRPRQLLVGTGVLVLLCLPFLLPQLVLWDQLPLTAGSQLEQAPARAASGYGALPESEVFVAQHGNDPLFWLRRTPLDTSNRVSIFLLAAAVLGSLRTRRGLAWRLWVPVLLGAVMVLGPYLRWGDQLWVLADRVWSLPFQWMRDLHPFLHRLTWPERWGMLIPLGLIALAARAPRPMILALLVVLENLSVSGNAPLQTSSFKFELCWADIPSGQRALLALPLRRAGLRAPRVGVHQRLHGRPLVNPVLLPPGADAPNSWRRWIEEQDLITYLTAYEQGRWPEDPGPEAVRALRQQGVGVIAVDAEPGGPLTEGGLNRYQAGVSRHLGRPVDLGCAFLWWLDPDVPPPKSLKDRGLEDGDAWRKAATRWKTEHPAPELDTLIQPSWDRVRRRESGSSEPGSSGEDSP